MLRLTTAVLVGGFMSSGGFRMTQRVGGECDGFAEGNPMLNTENFNLPSFDKYAYKLWLHKFAAADGIKKLYKAIVQKMLVSQDCWPADGPQDGDFPSYAGLFGRLAWHCSGTFRSIEGKFAGGCEGGRQRHWPEREWRDNGNLQMARALVGQIKAQDEFMNVSWGDLMTFAGTVGIKASDGPVSKFCFGRVDERDGVNSLELGSEGTTECELGAKCVTDTCPNSYQHPEQDETDHKLCALDQGGGRTQGSHDVGLIYVYPEGPQLKYELVGKGGKGAVHFRSQQLSAKEVRDTFNERMGWNDMYTVALLGGGHTLGRTHGNCAASTDSNMACKGEFTSTSGFEGAWTRTPSRWNYDYFAGMVDDPDAWVATKSPDGADQWGILDETNPHYRTMRLTADLALTRDPVYLNYSKAFKNDHQYFDDTFATAWHMLVHRSAAHPHENDLENKVGVCTTFDFVHDLDVKKLVYYLKSQH